jgi:hypothetical protein
MEIQDLLIQGLTLLAVDTDALGEVRLGDFIHVDYEQDFVQNCKSVTCLLTAIFDGGLSVPQFSVNVTDIVGPTFTTTRNLFTAATDQLTSSLLEIVVQVFRDDLVAITQGPVREFINVELANLVGSAKAPGACPERRNYTHFFPLGHDFCSHTFDEPANRSFLVQDAGECAAKMQTINGPTCEFFVPEGTVMDETTVACHYTARSKNLNFESSPLLRGLHDFMNSSLLNPESSFYVNELLGKVNIDTEFVFEVTDFPLQIGDNSFGTATMGFGEFKLLGLNTVDRLRIFDNRPYAPGGEATAFTDADEGEPTPEDTDMNSTMRRRRALLADPTEFDQKDNKFVIRK